MRDSVSHLLLLAVEHILSEVTFGRLDDYLMQGKGQLPSVTQYLREYCYTMHTGLVVRFGIWSCSFVYIFTKFATFAWNFMDLLLILISVGLVRLLTKFNRRMQREVASVSSCKFFHTTRRNPFH